MSLPKLSLPPDFDASALRNRLSEEGFTESAVARLLALPDISSMQARDFPGYIWRCEQDETPLSDLVSFFLLGQKLTRETLHRHLGEEVVTQLKTAGIVQKEFGWYRCAINLYPCAGSYFVTDYWLTDGQQPGQVYELGTDSFVLTRLTPRAAQGTALDLCTGSGVHAVLSATSGYQSTAVDLNPRALQYTRCNAALSGVEVETLEGDLYEPVRGRRFDLITANPPYVPSPDPEVLIHRSAGETGEEVPERLVAGLPEHLEPGGLFAMVLEYPVLEGNDYAERLQSWLSEERGWGIGVLSFGHKPLGAYIQSHLGLTQDYGSEYQAYLASYHRLGIRAMDFAVVYICRLASGELPGWRRTHSLPWPTESRAGRAGHWLRCLREFSDPDWTPAEDWTPSMSPHYSTLWRDHRGEKGLLENSQSGWFSAEPLSHAEVELMMSLEGSLSIQELKEQWALEISFLDTLRELGLRGALR